MQHDTYIKCDGRPIASYGPRTVVANAVEECEPDQAQFWGVYSHDPEGLAHHIGDAHDQASAAAFTQLVVESH